MGAFLIRRLVGMVLVLIAVTFLVFVIFVVVPGGDPAIRIAGKNANDQNIANIRETWGFDKSVPVQYWVMMKKTFGGDLISYTNQTNVLDQIVQGIPATFSLAVGAAIIWLAFGVLAGVLSAVTAGKLSDRLITILALIGISMPVFWLGYVARYLLAQKSSIFPDSGYVPFTHSPVQWFYHLILPWTVLAVLFIGFYGRVLRGNILDAINDDYVRTARAKGLAPRRVLVKHVLRNSLIPIVTLFGLDFAGVLGGGAILTETVFDLHGVGQYVKQSINNFDLPPIMGVTLFGAFFIVFFSVVVDLFYAYLDPRIRPS
ncbi:MAG: peptide/nickel transport system permease protein [Gaiellaceae bacterium]|jgi:peptide/nickel transport system permease protein|nr:peptide/nickel transport system permease protein [Gaiellaceae bacterium]